MSKRKTTEQFIEEAKRIHGNKYDYSLVDYINKRTKIKIICKEHGIFEQVPPSHLKGMGCKRCACIKINDNIRTTLNNFIERSNKIHNNKYDYSLISENTIINYESKVKIICPIHKEFEQTVGRHMNGNGCIKCRFDKRKSNKEKFIINANRIHNNKYDYSIVYYKDNKTKVKIICPIHGEFEQRPDGHLDGRGCPKCSKNGADKIFKNKKLYILYDNNADLYKIGISYNVKNRIKNIEKKLGYKINIFNEYDFGSSIFENNIHKMLKLKRKNHPINHGGYTEWFYLNDNDIFNINNVLKIK